MLIPLGTSSVVTNDELCGFVSTHVIKCTTDFFTFSGGFSAVCSFSGLEVKQFNTVSRRKQVINNFSFGYCKR